MAQDAAGNSMPFGKFEESFFADELNQSLQDIIETSFVQASGSLSMLCLIYIVKQQNHIEALRSLVPRPKEQQGPDHRTASQVVMDDIKLAAEQGQSRPVERWFLASAARVAKLSAMQDLAAEDSQTDQELPKQAMGAEQLADAIMELPLDGKDSTGSGLYPKGTNSDLRAAIRASIISGDVNDFLERGEEYLPQGLGFESVGFQEIFEYMHLDKDKRRQSSNAGICREQRADAIVQRPQKGKKKRKSKGRR